jgi:quercetin dioxygenase-like cupin family protein
MDKNQITVINSGDVPVEELTKNGATDVKVRYLIDERHGSERFALRLYIVQKDGHTPLDQHEYEHHVYILSGQGILRQSDRNAMISRPLREKDTIFIPSNAIHQFINERNEPLVFLCVKGNPALYGSRADDHTLTEENGTKNFC